jgi:hypothetical protein
MIVPYCSSKSDLIIEVMEEIFFITSFCTTAYRILDNKIEMGKKNFTVLYKGLGIVCQDLFPWNTSSGKW